MRPGIAHGGRLIEARRLYPRAPAPFLDLSTGINPHPYPAPDLPPESLHRLPEPEALEGLHQVAARAYGAADPAMVVAAPGTQILISLLPLLLGRLRGIGAACILGPTYGEHEAAWRGAGMATSIETGFAAFAAASARAGGAAILCNPNNPDGRVIDAPALRGLADGQARAGGVLIIDEAFADLQPHCPAMAGILPHPGLLVLRSFGKSYGFAGLRLGFALTSPGLACALRAALGPWPVSGPALTIAGMALADAPWRERMGTALHQDGERLDRLAAEAGLAGAGGTALFRLYRSPRAAEHFERLARRGILVRRFAHDPELLRLGLPGSQEAWSRLLAALGTNSGHHPVIKVIRPPTAAPSEPMP